MSAGRTSFIRKAVAAWGDLPDWAQTLAEACDDASLRQTAAILGVSPATVSLAINKERENLNFLKARVIATLMAATVTCPVLGEMGREACLRNQAKPFCSANPIRIQLYRACRDGCPNFKEANNERGAKSGKHLGAHGNSLAAGQRRL